MPDFPQIGDPGRILLSPFSEQALGVEYAALAAAAPASTAWGTINLIRAYPFVVPEPILIRKLWIYKGTTVTGNVDVGIYTDEGGVGTRLVGSGSTAVAATGSILQEFDVTDTVLGRGRYYLAATMSLTTTTMFANALTAQQAKMLGWVEAGTALPGGATLTWVAYTSAFQPVFGAGGRVLVV